MKKKNRILIFPLMLMGVALIFTGSCKKDSNNDNPITGETVKDVDGNVYHTVNIHGQIWMVENLKTTHYNDGNNTEIPNITDNSVWGGLITPAYCWYNNDVSYKTTFGALYNWYAVNTGNLCPTGWHVPSDGEWTTLINNLGGDTATAGGRLKETGTAHWVSPNTGADNSSGFTALPGGSHYTNGSFYYNGKYGWYWSSTESTATTAMHPYMVYNSSAITRKPGSKSIGFSVRCIKN
jgi:uncharacterized protein (TIGR02145 family)